ncbi:hypothetical protein QNM34_10990 [Rahnella bonaserana]|uniref:hypothetical protein n=1 Tax=Rahnella bonaserana TaxID=2816248 RepID=UPI0024C25140|nr:hypothetical protein [Rahnella bonaserana]WHZ42751.1 hypothetical protein QNM34_10990 [Rahnella bonaserana]
MKKLVLGLISITLSFSVFSAELMSKAEFEKVKQNYVKVGDISVSGGSLKLHRIDRNRGKVRCFCRIQAL